MSATEAVNKAVCAEQPGRRERKKQRTREALVDAAFALFQKKGFDATTVEEIADAVDVSSRTFFRYFGSKEDVLLTFQEEQFAAMLAALAAQPAELSVMTALRQAAVAVLRACEQGEYGFDPDRFLCLQHLMENSSAVLGSSLEHAQKKQADLTRVIADRMGADPAEDLRPHVVAASASCALRAAFDAYAGGVRVGVPFSDVVSEVFAILEKGVNYPSESA